MNAITKTMTKKDYVILALIGALLAVGLMMLFPPAYAANATAEIVVNIIVKLLRFIAIVVGIIFILVGAFKFSVARANEQGPDEQKAIMMAAAGVILILLFTVVINDDVVSSLVQMLDNV